ncbi:MAG TPA: MBL fold metallo-hydrolase [Candidatus Eisenbacteria bacterium]|nr:MBL fold metallo-hydrolase [Candidatus Eisenbacteria bacterium]
MRNFVRLSILFCLAAALAAAQAPNDQLPFDLKLIGPNIWAAIDDAKGDAGANAGFVVGDDGVAVIDTFENEAAAKAMLAQIRAFTQLPIKFVVNTHYHLDHVAGNGVFAQQGAVVLAQANVRDWMHTENLKFFGEKITPEQKKMVAKLYAPDVTYQDGVTLYLGTRRIVVRYLPGHTGGDSVVSIPDAGVIFCGDLFWRKTLPNLIDASTSEWLQTLSQFTEEPKDYMTNSALPRAQIYVPGHGDPGDLDDVRDFQGYLVWLRAEVQKQLDAGKKGDALVAAVLPELKDKYGSWAFFPDFSRSNILDMAAELQGTKRVPPREKK